MDVKFLKGGCLGVGWVCWGKAIWVGELVCMRLGERVLGLGLLFGWGLGCCVRWILCVRHTWG
jgi:hypothetical protein